VSVLGYENIKNDDCFCRITHQPEAIGGVVMINIKRIYDQPSQHDGKRILIDRLWPRGLKKEDAHIDGWVKEIAPSNELRKWFAHDPNKWGEFRKRFFTELQGKENVVGGIVDLARKGKVTLLFGSKEERFNNAVALKEYIDSRTKASERKKAA
jgi:uncharacterized protein YeaO (DUF488 family)